MTEAILGGLIVFFIALFMYSTWDK